LEWTQYTFDINDYEYQSIYIGIHCVSYDSWFLMVDDFMVTEGDPPVPDICCEGELVWTDVEPGATVNATFEISNCGEEGSILDWQFDSAPEWGIWEIEPDSGTDLAEGDSVTITVNVTAPENKSEEFNGKIRMINYDNSSDYCEVDVSLTTPKSKAFNFYVNFLKWLLDRFPKAFPIIGNILGL
jgi:hypothetical protein